MKKFNIWGISILIAMSITACGTADNEDNVEANTAAVVSEESAPDASKTQTDTSSQEGFSNLESEESDSEAVADRDNLPDELEEGEVAAVSYDDSDEEIAGNLPDVEVDLNLLRDKNPDVCSYILIPGTSINNPILKKIDSNDYYLEHNAENESDSAGCILMDMGNETDFTDPVTCLYAKAGDGEPFADLVDYLDPEFMQENEFIYVYSDEFVTQYKIYAAYKTDDTERLLVKYNFYDYAEYQQYIDEVFSIRDMSAVVDKDLKGKAIFSWNIITLTGIDQDGDRLIVQAVFNGRAINK